MKTNGLGAQLPRPVAARAAYGLDTGRVAPAPQRSTFPARQQPIELEAPAAPAAEPASLKPPKGTDPELWKVLTADERAFFASKSAMGPLSYGHKIATSPTISSRGGRINLRG